MKGETQTMKAEGRRTVHAKGNPLTLIGREVRPGDKAPTDVQVIKPDMTPFNLKEDAGKPRLYSVVPSLDTSVCNKQTVTFNKLLGEMDGPVTAYAVSVDIPHAQKRFAEHYKVDNMKLVSDYREVQFGENYGMLIKELRMLTRGVVVVDKNDTIAYMEIVPDTVNEPNYDRAIAALKDVLKK